MLKSSRTAKESKLGYDAESVKVKASPDNLNSTQVHIGEDKFEAVSNFRYFGDVIGESGGCVDATNAGISAAWIGFLNSCYQLLPIVEFH